ncbi:MAG: signal peptidase I [Chloroflexota bacterium]|nr:signal peptidase I [Chloroflexota bacterium]
MKVRHLGLLLAAIGLAAWFVVLRPTALGGPASYIFVSGTSMEPTLETGDLVILQRADEYAGGDVIAFAVPEGEPGAGALVIHRIVGGSAAEGFVMRGDNKPAPDDWRPTSDLIEGRMWLHVPGAGTIVATLKQPAVFASLLAGLVVFFIVLDGGGTSKRREPASVASDG